MDSNAIGQYLGCMLGLIILVALGFGGALTLLALWMFGVLA